jgi:hypothetical protein
MRLVPIACLLWFSCAAIAQTVASKDEVVEGGLQSGQRYQLAQHCGASDAALGAYKDRFEAEARGRQDVLAKLDINILKLFMQGRLNGDLAFEDLKAKPQADRDAACQQALKSISPTG